MNQLPFNHNLLLWRLARGLTQVQLAGRAGVPQPNLSDIERGAQDVSLRTLRALALALGVRPGLLADGVPPQGTGEVPVPDRQALERIAASLTGTRVRLRTDEREMSQYLGLILHRRIGALRGQRRVQRNKRRSVRAAWISLQARYPKAVIDSLIQRASEQAVSPRTTVDAPPVRAGRNGVVVPKGRSRGHGR